MSYFRMNSTKKPPRLVSRGHFDGKIRIDDDKCASFYLKFRVYLIELFAKTCIVNLTTF